MWSFGLFLKRGWMRRWFWILRRLWYPLILSSRTCRMIIGIGLRLGHVLVRARWRRGRFRCCIRNRRSRIVRRLGITFWPIWIYWPIFALAGISKLRSMWNHSSRVHCLNKLSKNGQTTPTSVSQSTTNPTKAYTSFAQSSKTLRSKSSKATPKTCCVLSSAS